MATVYKPRILAPSFIERGVSQSMELEVWDGASLTAVASGTYTLIGPAGSTIETGAVVVTANVAAYTWTPAAGATLGTGYMEEWALATASVTLPVFRRPAVVCHRRPWAPLTNQDILDRQPKLTDYPTGQTSWDPQIEDAWSVICGRVANLAHAQPDEVLNTNMFRELCMLLTLSHVYDARATYVTGEAAEKAEEFRAKFDVEWERTGFDIDDDRDGLVEHVHRQSTRSQHPRATTRGW